MRDVDILDRFEDWLIDEIDILGAHLELMPEKHEAEYVLKALREIREDKHESSEETC